MADNSDKVAKLVQRKLEDYFNRQRVENEFDPSGKGIHTTTPAVVQLELSYLQAAEKQWKAKKKKKKTNNKNDPQKAAEQGDGQTSQSKEGESPNDGCQTLPDVSPKVSPRVTTNSRIKSRVKDSEIDRITKNAQTTLDRISVEKIQSVHRYRPHLILSEQLNMIKVARVSRHVDAILNTEHALDCAEENDDREAAKKYVEEKNEQPESKEKDQRGEPEKTEDTGRKQKRTPLWLRVELEKARKQAESDDGSLNKQTREELGNVDSLEEGQETAGEDGEAEMKEEAGRETEEKQLSADHQEMVREDETNNDNKEGKESLRDNEMTKDPLDENTEIQNTCTGSDEKDVHVDQKRKGGENETNEKSMKELEGDKRRESVNANENKNIDRKLEQGKVETQKNSTISDKHVGNEQNEESGKTSQQGNEEKDLTVKQNKDEGKTKQNLSNGELQNDGSEDQNMRISDGGNKLRSEPVVDGMGQQGGKERSGEQSVGQDKQRETKGGQEYRTEVYVRSESVVSLTAAVNEDEQEKTSNDKTGHDQN